MRRVLFLADQYADAHRSEGVRHPGGAELTDRVAIEACPWPIHVEAVVGLDPAILEGYDLLVVANAGRASLELNAAIVRHGRYVLFEHDVRICRWRGNFFGSIEPLHRGALVCCCPHAALAPLFARALGAVFLTERQARVYRRNPFFREPPSRVLGCSLFSGEIFAKRAGAVAARPRAGTCILYSPNTIKGTERAREHCRALGVEPFELRDMSPEEVLDRLSQSERFVYLPEGLEPAGRMPVEARLLGCEVVVNANVGVSGEAWWRGDRAAALDFLQDAPARFWRMVDELASRGRRSSARGEGGGGGAAREVAERLFDRLTKLSLPKRVLRRLDARSERQAMEVERYPAWS